MKRSSPNSRSGFISVAGVLLVLIVAATVTAGMQRWSLALSFAGLALLLFVLVGNGPIVRWLAGALQAPSFFETPRDFGGTTAIVLLGDGGIMNPNNISIPRWLAYSRIECAVRLYRLGAAGGSSSHVIVTGDDSADIDGRGSMYAERLQALGVRLEHLIVEGRGRNTYRQAELATGIVNAGRYDRVFLVTSGLHMMRAQRYFRHFGLQPIPVASDYVTIPITPFPRGENFAIAEIAIHQHVGLARLRLYNALGLNKPSESKSHSAVGTNS